MTDSRAFTQGASAGNGVRDVVFFLNRHKLIIVLPMVLFAGAAWMIVSHTPPRFVAKAVLALDARKVQIVEHEIVSRLPQENAALRTELDVIGSRSAADEVVDRLALTSDAEVLKEVRGGSPWYNLACDAQGAVTSWLPWIAEICPATARGTMPTLSRSQVADWIVGNLKVTNDGRSLSIEVAFTSGNPELAARIANAVGETYLDDQVRTKSVSTVKARDWLHEQLNQMRHDLDTSIAAVENFGRQSRLNDAKNEMRQFQSLDQLNVQLLTAQSDLARAEARLKTFRENATLPEGLASTMTQQLRNELAQIDSRIAEIRVRGSTYRLDDLEARALEARAVVLRKQMNQEMNRLLASLLGEVQAARKKEAELTQTVEGVEKHEADAGRSKFQLTQLQREADANRSMYESLLSRYREAMEQESLAAPDARFISRAEPPGAPTYPNKQRFLLFGTIGGLAVGGALAFLRDGFDRRIRQTSVVEIVTGVPVFGLLPKVSRWRGIEPQDYPLNDPQSKFCTALARVHTVLRAPKSADSTQVILVTSAQPNDGKTSFCISLARSLARSRLRVLVVDADPYRSRVPSLFGASVFQAVVPSVGQPARLGDIVQADPKSTAHFVPAPKKDDLHLLIHSGGFTKLIEEARRAYDIVIIDTPPVMMSPDAAVIARFADTRLLLVRWGRTYWDEMTAAVGFLRLCRVELDGIVVVGADTGSGSYGQIASSDTGLLDTRVIRPASYRGFSDVQ
jgi:polysaccharide biosynthesis transport protein